MNDIMWFCTLVLLCKDGWNSIRACIDHNFNLPAWVEITERGSSGQFFLEIVEISLVAWLPTPGPRICLYQLSKIVGYWCVVFDETLTAVICHAQKAADFGGIPWSIYFQDRCNLIPARWDACALEHMAKELDRCLFEQTLLRVQD